MGYWLPGTELLSYMVTLSDHNAEVLSAVVPVTHSAMRIGSYG